jgi:phosphatidate phosphatase PAH1
VEGPTSVVNLEEGGNNIHPPHPDPDDEDKDQDNEDGTLKENDVMDTGNHSNPSAGQTSTGGSRANLGAPATDKQKGTSTLSEKVHEIAQFYLNQKGDISPGPSKLSPIPDMVAANDKVMDWINQTTQIDNSCINLLQDMELGQEEGDFYESQAQDLSQEELSAHLDPVPL